MRESSDVDGMVEECNKNNEKKKEIECREMSWRSAKRVKGREVKLSRLC